MCLSPFGPPYSVHKCDHVGNFVKGIITVSTKRMLSLETLEMGEIKHCISKHGFYLSNKTFLLTAVPVFLFNNNLSLNSEIVPIEHWFMK